MRKHQPNNQLTEKVSHAIQIYHLLEEGQLVIVAVSGGMDSMVLLHVLRELGYSAVVAHFDHQTRGGQSTEDAVFVQHYCENEGIPFFLRSEPIHASALAQHKSFEAYARQRRYAFFIDIAKMTGTNTIALGHHEQDQVETAIMGMFGLASDFGPWGMAPVSTRGDIRLIRPLLECTKKEIQCYGESKKIPWTEDSTNNLPHHTRNKIRLELLPIIQGINPKAQSHFVRVLKFYRDSSELLDKQSRELLRVASENSVLVPKIQVLDVKKLCEAPPTLRRNAIKLLLFRLGVPMSYLLCISVEKFIVGAPSGKRFELPNNVILYHTKDHVHILTSEVIQQIQPIKTQHLCIPGEICVEPFTICAYCLENYKFSPAEANEWQMFFDADTIPHHLEVHSRKAGDRMVPFGMASAKKVKEILIDASVPHYWRDRVPILSAGAEIIGMLGVKRSALAPVLPTTKRVLKISCTLTP